MGLTDNIRGWLWNIMTPPDDWFDVARMEQLAQYERLKNYYEGDHRRQIKTKTGQPDDNLILNFTQLVVERSISLLFGSGVEFELPGEDDAPNRLYIDDVWNANNKDIFLHKLGQYGSIYGTCFIKIVPEGVESMEDENAFLPRLIALNPMFMKIETSPEDVDTIERYEMRFNTVIDDREVARKEITEPVYSIIQEEDGEFSGGGEIIAWKISNYIADHRTGGQWELMYDPQIWEYNFAPIIHWQNLPKAGEAYGRSDVEDILELNDRINFIAGNISKIIRYHAHPKTWGRNALSGSQSKASWGPDEMVLFSGDNALIQNLEMQSDLQSSQQYLMMLRQSLFDISRTVDITSLSDKLGALTNFGLRVLFMDSVNKNNTKREIYGNGLVDLNHRLLVIGEQQDVDGGEVRWPETLPEDETEKMAGDGFDLEKGLASKETISEKRGYDWEAEQERIEEERASGDNIGAAILRTFERGQ